MSDFASDTPAAETPSTVIDADTTASPSGGGTPKVQTEEPKPEAKASLRDTISSVVKEDAKPKEEEAPKDEKPTKVETEDKAPEKTKDEEKPAQERGEGGKFAAKPKDDEDVANTRQPANDQAEKGEAKHYTEPPKNFLPDAKEMWRNVPRPVRRDIEIMVRDHQQAIERSQQTNERYEAIRPFDELAQQNGRDLRESLFKINQVENAIQHNPVYGINMLLQEIGPRKADGQPISIYELASHIVNQGPEAYKQQMRQAQQQQPREPDPQVIQAQQERDELKARLVTVEVIEPFKKDHPRYDELQEPIAKFLQSGMIPASLSPAERLEAAYVMAERLHPPSSRPADEQEPEPASSSRAADSLSGSKSIKSAPGAVSDDFVPERGGSIRDLLQDEMRRQKRS